MRFTERLGQAICGERLRPSSREVGHHSKVELDSALGPFDGLILERRIQVRAGVRQVIQGGGNRPAYGKNLSPAETTALVEFLKTLYPPGQGPARDASRAADSGVRP